MSSYFDQVQQDMCDLVERRAHRRWYVRLVSARRARLFGGVLAALVVAVPATGAVTRWFGLGAPARAQKQFPAEGAGAGIAQTSRLLSLRVADPAGGPAWGLRLVRTTRGDMCIQLGRVHDGRLGSLGIDDAWNDDHLFHPFPGTYEGEIPEGCGTTDANGNAFLNTASTDVVASAYPANGAGIAAATRSVPCRVIAKDGDTGPLCPRGSSRIVFMGLLGPDAVSVTYRAPDGKLATERTSGGDGAYLLVFRRDKGTCRRYMQDRTSSYGPCGMADFVMGVSPELPGAITAVTYRDGHVCHVVARRRALLAGLTGGDSNPACPPAGYVPVRQRVVTHAQLATPISVRVKQPTKRELSRFSTVGVNVPVHIAFTARAPVTSSRSWYEYAITAESSPCAKEKSKAVITYGDIRAGQRVRFLDFEDGYCPGVYHGVIGYRQDDSPVNPDMPLAGIPGKDGSIVVGHFSFTIR